MRPRAHHHPSRGVIDRRLGQWRPQRHEIRVGIPTGYLPIAGVNLVGEPAGLLPDIWRKWSEKTGVPVVFKTATFGETVSMLRHGAIDVHASLFRNEVRKAWLDVLKCKFANDFPSKLKQPKSCPSCKLNGL